MIHKNLLLLFLLIFPATVLYSSKGFVNAQIDLNDDDSEADIEDPQSDTESSIIGKDDLMDEDEPEDKTLKASPDADTTFIFTQPAGLGTELPAGKDVHFLVGFANRGSKDFIVESMDASFRYPLDFTFHIQNFSAIPYNRVVKPKQDISLYYAFYTSETYSSRPFGLVVNLYYKDADGHQYLDAVFNETITIVEIEESLDGETFFMYVLLAACAVLILVAAQQFLVNFTKKKMLSGQKIETGTQNHHNDVDYDWLPKETLNELNKSPRRSDRLSPRKSKHSHSKNAQTSPKQSPKQQTQQPQRRAKRGAGGKEN
ncbi:translocon-associated protein subunit alpha-like [Uloborus diversus]|uniref:translocon-associated protein subunit alpha-like n=1 Tax=Uloborus diversus TaxID=327109 RepID=UPI00240A3001|nr:translocon-associated protein subunit alpha-like [Uloborus diversus]